VITNSKVEGRADQEFNGPQEYSCQRESRAPSQRGFCIEQLVKNISWLLPVNRFTVLKIEYINISDNEPKDIYPSAPVSHPIPWYYETTKKKTISCIFINLMGNIQEYNIGKI